MIPAAWFIFTRKDCFLDIFINEVSSTVVPGAIKVTSMVLKKNKVVSIQSLSKFDNITHWLMLSFECMHCVKRMAKVFQTLRKCLSHETIFALTLSITTSGKSMPFSMIDWKNKQSFSYGSKERSWNLNEQRLLLCKLCNSLYICKK